MVCNVMYKTATRWMENSLTSDLSTFENVFCLNYYEYHLTCFLNSHQKYIDLKKEEEHSRIGTRVPTSTELMLKGPNCPKVCLCNFLHLF
ncbi:hypothetical protein M9H77_06114 [Catharanthus roseus]|uniref:Uncharacterized protein n=1 Tax=Catharanthus roseus TaxID=4058 RepID=A0ACC0BRC2_CATRO|nr:hypothetical protein M9H77_06114 [Catharanthus roseus]